MKKGCIIYNETKEKACEIYEKVLMYFKNNGVETISVENISLAEFVVVIGGDGTLLRASKEITKYQNLDVIAINAGSLGFLTEIKAEETFKMLDMYLSGEYNVEERGLLEIDHKGIKYVALNEVMISKGGVMDKILKIHVNSKAGFITDYKADGLIIATPTGSTAYSLSAGGPIVMPTLKAMVITPIAPHNLTNRPIVIDGNEKIYINLQDRREGYLVIDGESYGEVKVGDVLEIVYSENKLKLVLPKDRNYYAVLREKLKWGDNLC